MEICKIHWIFMIFKSQYCFANVSATEALIFMKFETYIHKTIKKHQMIFRNDPCTDARTQGRNMRTRVSLWQKAGTHTFMPLVSTCVHGSLQILFWSFFTILWIYVSNFIKIRAFVADIFAKQYWLLKIINFQCILRISTFLHLKSLHRWIITE